MKETFNWSRFIAVLSFLATLATVAASVLEVVRPGWAVVALAAAAGINAFTERVQGGASKV